MLDIEVAPRTALDYTGIVLVGVALAALIGMGLFGSIVGFVQTLDFANANAVVVLAGALLGAASALYLIVELGERLNRRTILAVCVLAGMFSFFAGTKGIPAAWTLLSGTPIAVTFVVTDYSWSKSCRDRLIAVAEGYEPMSYCARGLEPLPNIGDALEVRGMATDWGIVMSQVGTGQRW